MTDFDPSDVPPREDFDAEPDLAELLVKVRELAKTLPGALRTGDSASACRSRSKPRNRSRRRRG